MEEKKAKKGFDNFKISEEEVPVVEKLRDWKYRIYGLEFYEQRLKPFLEKNSGAHNSSRKEGKESYTYFFGEKGRVIVEEYKKSKTAILSTEKASNDLIKRLENRVK